MKKAIFFVTRYSLLYKKRTGVRLADGSSNLQEYRKKLMSKERLENRLSLFSNICVPSIAAQVPCDAELHHIIVTSDQLPGDHLEELSALVTNAEKDSAVRFHVIAAESGVKGNTNNLECYDDFSSAVKQKIRQLSEGKCLFATVRLDDDDALSSTFAHTLSKRLQRSNSCLAVTFPVGYQARFDSATQTLSQVKDLNYPKIALGLSFINFFNGKRFDDNKVHVYQLGGHTKIDLFYPTLVDGTSHMYLRTVSAHNDSGDIGYHDFLPDAYTDCADINHFDSVSMKKSVGKTGWPQLSRGDFAVHMKAATKQKANRAAKHRS